MFRSNPSGSHHAGYAHTLLVCLPPGSSDSLERLAGELCARLAPVVAGDAARLCPEHLPVPHRLSGAEQALLVAPEPGMPGLQTAHAAPVGLLDHDRHRDLTRAAAGQLHTEWSQVVAGTDPARPLRPYIDRHPASREPGRIEQVLDAFCSQPRIATMLVAEATHRVAFVTDQYGPALEAHQAGAAQFVDYLVDLRQLGDGLLGLDGQPLLATSPPRPRIEHTLVERTTYHVAARDHLHRLPADTVVAAVHTHL